MRNDGLTWWEDLKENFVVYFLFWTCSLGTFFAWFSFPNTVFHWVDLFGKDVLLFLTTAYTIPGIFVQIFQAKFDMALSQRFSKGMVFGSRMVVVFIGLIGITATAPLITESLALFLSIVVLTGILSSTAFGTLFQLVTLYPKRATSFLSLGYASPGLILSILSLTVFGPDHHTIPLSIPLFFGVVAGIVFVGFLAFIVLLGNSWTELTVNARPYLNIRSETNINADPDHMNQPALTEGAAVTLDSIATLTSGNVNNKLLVKRTWKLLLSIFILMISRLTVFTVLTHVPNQTGDQGFPQKLVFINLGCDLGGRVLTLLLPALPELKAALMLLIFTLIQFSSVALALIYIMTDIIPRSDIGAFVFLSIFSTTTGYLQTQVYAYAPLQTKAKFRPQIAALMNVCSQVGNIIALGIGFILQLFAF